jgi:hypothetical protein
MPEIPPELVQSPILQYNYAGCSILYCNLCNHPIFPKMIWRHLTVKHHHLPLKIRQSVYNYYKALADQFINKEAHASLPLPPNGSTPLSFLPIYDGFVCNHLGGCGFLTSNYDNIRSHLNKVHQVYRADCKPYIGKACLQSFYSLNRSKYWIVNMEEGPKDRDKRSPR